MYRGLIFGICRLCKNKHSGKQRTMLISKTTRETTASQLQKCVNLHSFLGGGFCRTNVFAVQNTELGGVSFCQKMQYIRIACRNFVQK